MASVINLFALAAFVGMVSAAAGPAYFVPVEHRDLTGYRNIQPISDLPSNTLYQYQIVPSDEYSVAEYDPEISIWDYIPSPSTALSCVATKALSIGKWVLVTALSIAKWVLAKGIFVLLGVGLTIGFCAFTPFCTLTIYRPFFGRDSSALVNVPYMDEIESFFESAYDKFQTMNEVKKRQLKK